MPVAGRMATPAASSLLRIALSRSQLKKFMTAMGFMRSFAAMTMPSDMGYMTSVRFWCGKIV